MKVSVEPKRYTMRMAAQALVCHYETVRKLVADGTLRPLPQSRERGRGVRVYLSPAEVNAYAEGGRAAVERLRAKAK